MDFLGFTDVVFSSTELSLSSYISTSPPSELWLDWTISVEALGCVVRTVSVVAKGGVCISFTEPSISIPSESSSATSEMKLNSE